MNKEEALSVAKNWYNSRPDEQKSTLNYLNEMKEQYTSEMSWLIRRIQAIETLIICLKEQTEEIPEVYLKAFEDGK